MGLFDFVKDVGANIFKGKDRSQEIETHLREEFGSKVASLKAAYEDGTVKVVGVCDSQVTKESVILVAGNIKGVERVVSDHLRVKAADEVLMKPGQAPVPPPVVKQEEIIEEKPVEEELLSDFYTIKAGDTLSKIAKAHYGDAMKYPAIFEANRDVIKDPNKIYPGQQIRLPKKLE
ncbi:LysM peptidoglycan-binding domain-containing protein [bacterium]|nr:LysM peptidoglycan-binding domain-containing protein [bacterium]